MFLPESDAYLQHEQHGKYHDNALYQERCFVKLAKPVNICGIQINQAGIHRNLQDKDKSDFKQLLKRNETS